MSAGKFFPENYNLKYSGDESSSQSDSEDDTCRDVSRLPFPSLLPKPWSSDEDEEHEGINLKGPLASLYSVRHALVEKEYLQVFDWTKSLLKLNSNKIKEPIIFVLARYLACLRKHIENLPKRRERRGLTTKAARHIVNLQNPKFSAILDELERRWGKSMPEPLFADECVNRMLVNLEDGMFAKYYPLSNSQKRSFFLDWSMGPFDYSLPLPIVGLEFTLTFYHPSTRIDLHYITDLNLSYWDIEVLPPWISRMTKLRSLKILRNRIPYLPAWIIHMKHLHCIEALETPFYLEEQTSKLRLGTDVGSWPYRKPRLVDLTVNKINEFIDHGGDWTILLDLPMHLLDRIRLQRATTKEIQPLRLRLQDAFLVEKVSDIELRGSLSNWTRTPSKFDVVE